MTNGTFSVNTAEFFTLNRLEELQSMLFFEAGKNNPFG